MNVTDKEKQDYAVVLAKFDDFFKVRHNIIFECARFNCRSQQEGETAEEFIMELYKLVENCNYGGLQEEMIKDRLVVDIRNQRLSEKMQLDPNLNLEKAKKMARQQEAVHDQSRKLKKEEGATVDAVSSRGPFPFKKDPSECQIRNAALVVAVVTYGKTNAQQKRSFATIAIKRDTTADSAYTGRTLQSLT